MRSEYRILTASIAVALLLCAATFLFAEQRRGAQEPRAAAISLPEPPGTVETYSFGQRHLGPHPFSGSIAPASDDPLPCNHPLARSVTVGGRRYRTCIYGHEWAD